MNHLEIQNADSDSVDLELSLILYISNVLSGGIFGPRITKAPKDPKEWLLAPPEQRMRLRGKELNLRVYPESGTKIQAAPIPKMIIKKGKGRSLNWNRNKVWKKNLISSISLKPLVLPSCFLSIIISFLISLPVLCYLDSRVSIYPSKSQPIWPLHFQNQTSWILLDKSTENIHWNPTVNTCFQCQFGLSAAQQSF